MGGRARSCRDGGNGGDGGDGGGGAGAGLSVARCRHFDWSRSCSPSPGGEIPPSIDRALSGLPGNPCPWPALSLSPHCIFFGAVLSVRTAAHCASIKQSGYRILYKYSSAPSPPSPSASASACSTVAPGAARRCRRGVGGGAGGVLAAAPAHPLGMPANREKKDSDGLLPRERYTEGGRGPSQMRYTGYEYQALNLENEADERRERSR